MIKWPNQLSAGGSLHLHVSTLCNLYVMDEVLTPDSSRYWPADAYQVGTSPPSYDKQFVRDYLETLDWDKTAPGPRLPAEVIEKTRAKYAEALDKLAGISVD